MRKIAAALLALLPAPPALAGDGYKALANEFSLSAAAGGLARIAVLPFSPSDSSPAADGLNVSERLLTRLVRAGRVKAVERGLLDHIMQEQRLAQTGALDPASLRRLGKILAVDGIVTGTFAGRGKKLTVDARLIDVESGVILAASERSVARDWTESGRAPALFAPRGEAPALSPEAEPRCARALRAADAWEASVLELKARHWAYLLRQGLTLEQLKETLGTSISDEDLLARFYGRVLAHLDRGAPRELSSSEAERFMAADQRAFGLRSACGI